MIQPLQEKKNPGEYLNRVKKVEHDHGPGSRDFSYEIGEVTDEQEHRRQHPQEFGEDTYEHSDGETAGDAAPHAEPYKPETTPPSDEGNLDITV